MPVLKLRLKKNFDASQLDTGGLCLGYQEIVPIFNLGPRGDSLGGDQLIVQADGELMSIPSPDLIHDLDAYAMELE